jgi:uncharacterized protein with FMN-binding domain
MAKKMNRRLVALSASAVATIYLTGFLATQPVAVTMAADEASSVLAATTTPATATATPSVVVGASATATPTTSATATGTYADGTYSATGTSRFGNVSVSVTIAAGTVSNVQITKVTTSFPMSRIASLPSQVIAAQSANLNVVTGATYSSQAFKQAVQTALAQAQAAGSTATAG